MRTHFDHELAAIRARILDLGGRVSDATARAVHALTHLDVQEAQDVKRDDRTSDELRYAIENACLVSMATQQPMARDLRALLGAAFVAVELERCGDYAKGIARAARRIARGPAAEPVTFNLLDMSAAALGMLARSLAAFAAADPLAARAVIAEDEGLDALYDTLLKAVVARMSAEPDFSERGIWLLHAGHCLERIGDRATNVAERVVFITTGSLTGDLNIHPPERARALPTHG